MDEEVPADRVEKFLKDNPNKEFSTPQLCTALNITHGVCTTAVRVLRQRHIVSWKAVGKGNVYSYNTRQDKL